MLHQKTRTHREFRDPQLFRLMREPWTWRQRRHSVDSGGYRRRRPQCKMTTISSTKKSGISMNDTKETLREIKSKGHWRVVIRPFPYKGRVPSVTDLQGILQRSSVQIRGGWDFPHVERSRRPRVGTDYIEQAVNLEGGDLPDIKEFWRFYQSGQFIYFGGFLLDWTRSTRSWTEQPPVDPCRHPLLSAGDIVCRYAEFMEFASALSLSEAGSSRIGVEIIPTRLAGRVLWLEYSLPSDSDLGGAPNGSYRRISSVQEISPR